MDLVGACLLDFSTSICTPIDDRIAAKLQLFLPTTWPYFDEETVIFLILKK